MTVGMRAGMNVGYGVSIASALRQQTSSTAAAANYTIPSFTLAAGELGLLWTLGALTGGPSAETFAGTLGGTWTEIGSGVAIGTDRRIRLYRSLSGSPRTGTVIVQHGAPLESFAAIAIGMTGIDLTGVNGAGAIVQSATNTGSAITSLAVTLAAFGGTRNVAAYGVGRDTNTAIAPGAGMTELGEQNQTALDIRLQAEVGLAVAAPTATFSSSVASAIAVEVKAA